MKIGLFLILCFQAIKSIAQTGPFEAVNLQGQILSTHAEFADFRFLVVNYSDEIIWNETHDLVPVNTDGTFNLFLGKGTVGDGIFESFEDINWLNVERVELYNITDGSDYLQAEFRLNSFPFAFHSKNVLNAPSLTDLIDTDLSDLGLNKILFYDGTNYLIGLDEKGDTANFALNGSYTSYSDTANFAFNHFYADSTLYTYLADSAIYSFSTEYASLADSADYSDSALVTHYAIGNWSRSGNLLMEDGHAVGTNLMENLVFKTNNNKRLNFDGDGNVYNEISSPGFGLIGDFGFLAKLANDRLSTTSFEDSYLYFDGRTSSFHGGVNDGDKDSLMGEYSFSWGNNTGTNGMYSTVFGKDTYGDSVLNYGSMYDAVSSFAVGRNCHVTRIGVAIGDSANANFYRSVAIGKNINSGVAAATFAMGTNIIVSGATSLAIGQNIVLDGAYDIGFGKNIQSQDHFGTFLFGDNSSLDTMANTADNEFLVRADGGVVLYSSTDLSMGVTLLSGGGSWSMISDRDKKENIQLVNYEEYKTKFDNIPVYHWKYLNQEVAHIGPMAQDFYNVFEVGEYSNYINMIDSDGLVFLGVKRLKIRLDQMRGFSGEVDKIKEAFQSEEQKLIEIENQLKELNEKLDN